MVFTISLKSYSQDVDSLRKYSYYIVSDTMKPTLIPGQAQTYVNPIGTGYFIRHKRKLYLLTALHVLTGCRFQRDLDSSIRVNEPFPDAVKVFYNKENGEIPNKPENYFWLDIRHLKNKKCPITPIDPDIVACEINFPLTDTVYSIEHLINVKSSIDTNGTISIWGYPLAELAKSTLFYNNRLIANSTNLKFSNNNFLKNYKFIWDSGKEVTYWIHHVIQSKDVTASEEMKGYSGSPVFIKNKNGWIFIGTFIGGVKGNVVALKPIYAKEAILKL